MLLIVAHHYVVNSGVGEQFDFLNVSSNMVFMQLFGMWGKTAINVFVLISGYFLCEMSLTWQRWLKVYLQWKGYRIVIFLALYILGYETLSFTNLFKIAFEIVRNVNKGFICSFLFFYAFVPFFNILLKRLSKRDHQMLIGLMLFFITFCGTFLYANSVFVESIWYMVLYFIAAYIKKYGSSWMQNFNICLIGLIISVVLAILSVVVLDLVGMRLGGLNIANYFVSDSHKLLALLVGLFCFLTFKNMKPKENRLINTVASTVFGVLCIHASSDAMRLMLWNDIVNVPGAYSYPLGKLVLYSICVVFAVFAICSLIDYLRLKYIEKPLFRIINSKTLMWQTDDRCIIKQILAS